MNLKIAVVGNPNAGKTSVFNCLTGLNHHVGNYPGVTVDKKIGFATEGNVKLEIIDLPGIYSLYPTSLDEYIVLETLTQPSLSYYPDIILYVADVSNLERHLLLFSQVSDLGIPIVLALTMNDIAFREGIVCNTQLLSKLLHTPVIEVNGRTGSGVNDLKKLLCKLDVNNVRPKFYPIKNKEMILEIQDSLSINNPYTALIYAHHWEELKHLQPSQKNVIKEINEKYQFSSIKAQVEETINRYSLISNILKKSLQIKSSDNYSITDRADDILTHPILGMVIFLATLFIVFQALFAWASYPMDLIEGLFGYLSEIVKNNLANSWYTSLLADGIIAGLGGILVFIPQIALLFLIISILEEVGYMARAVFLTDKIMRKFGLNGRSMVALLSGVACAIPAILSTRTISNWKERLITIMVTPLMSCSARIPVFTLLAAFVVPENQYLWGVFNLQGIVVMIMYLLGAVSALLAAFVLSKIVKTQEMSIFVMELPPYRMPHWRNVGINVFEKVKSFVLEAGKVIMVISVVLWVLSSYGDNESMQNAEKQAILVAQQKNLSNIETEALLSSYRLEASYAGSFGKIIEPIIEPIGFDWKIGISLLTSFAAREVFVGTMAVIYSAGNEDDTQPLIDRMRKEINPTTGNPTYSMASALSLLVYYVFAMQCMSTLAVVKRETKSWTWTLIQFIYMTLLAYLMSFVTFQIFS
ncbi:MAG: ferrous iron transport protein B [Bacteroidia bacterium]